MDWYGVFIAIAAALFLACGSGDNATTPNGKCPEANAIAVVLFPKNLPAAVAKIAVDPVCWAAYSAGSQAAEDIPANDDGGLAWYRLDPSTGQEVVVAPVDGGFVPNVDGGRVTMSVVGESITTPVTCEVRIWLTTGAELAAKVTYRPFGVPEGGPYGDTAARCASIPTTDTPTTTFSYVGGATGPATDGQSPSSGDAGYE